MFNGKLKAAQQILAENGVVIDDEIVLAVLDAVQGEEHLVYQKKDFVCFYEGMGEAGHGYVLSETRNGYKVQPYMGGKPYGGPRTVTSSDMRGVATLADAAEYERVRGGG